MEVSMMIGVRVEKNNIDLGTRPIKCESRLRELEQILKGQDIPIEFMCQSLGITSTDKDKLDLYLVQSFQKNIPPNFHLLNSTSSSSSTSNTASASSPFITYKGKPFGYRYKETSEELKTVFSFINKIKHYPSMKQVPKSIQHYYILQPNMDWNVSVYNFSNVLVAIKHAKSKVMLEKHHRKWLKPPDIIN